MNREWKAADVVKHFKGNLYVIVGIAKEATNSDELRDKVVYRLLDGTGGLWVRDLDEFNSEVDNKKYPDATQKFRFELVETHN